MAFISPDLLVETPLISLFDDDNNCPPITFATLSPQILNSGSAMSQIPKAPTLDLINFAKQPSRGKLYDEIYQKNLLRFLATGGFAVRKTATELSADAPILHSIIDESVPTNGYPSSLTHQQELTSGGIPTDVVDYDGGSSTEFEFEPREVGNGILMCLSDEAIRPPFENGESDSVWRRPSVVGELVDLSDEITHHNVLVGQENFEVEEEEDDDDDDNDDDIDGGDGDYARSSLDNIGPSPVQSSDAERSASSESNSQSISNTAPLNLTSGSRLRISLRSGNLRLSRQ